MLLKPAEVVRRCLHEDRHLKRNRTSGNVFDKGLLQRAPTPFGKSDLWESSGNMKMFEQR